MPQQASTHTPSSLPSTSEPEPERTVDPTRHLPGGRAILGGVLIAVAAIGLFVAARPPDATPRTSFVVARHTIDPGHRITASDVAFVPIDLPVAVASHAVSSRNIAVGAIAMDHISEGSVVNTTQIASGSRNSAKPLLSFSIPADRAVGGALTSGDRIDLLVTWDHSPDADTEVVGDDLPVVEVTRPGRDSLGDTSKLTISVNVPPGTDLVELTRAIRVGQLTVVRTTGTTK